MGKANSDQLGRGSSIVVDGVWHGRGGKPVCRDGDHPYDQQLRGAPPDPGQCRQGRAASSALPYDGTPGATAPVSTAPTSLPFTGADIEEMAIIGLGAVVAGGVLLRRRRLSA